MKKPNKQTQPNDGAGEVKFDCLNGGEDGECNVVGFVEKICTIQDTFLAQNHSIEYSRL